MTFHKIEKNQNQNKSFSHALRHWMGLRTIVHSSNLANEATETDIQETGIREIDIREIYIREIDIQSIAQKHDLGEPLSDKEISFLVVYANSALSGRLFLHQETIQTLADLFTSFIKSHCYAANEHTIHVFKKFNLANVAFGEKKGGEAVASLLSRGFYSCMEEVATTFQARVKTHPNPLNDPTITEPLKAFVSCLAYFSYGNEEHIISPAAFREALEPYLKFFIQMAKVALYKKERKDEREEGEGRGIPPFHTDQNAFVHEHRLEKPFYFHSKHYQCALYQCHIWANELTNVRATFVFNKNAVTLSLGFSAFDDLLEVARSLSRFISFMEKNKERGVLQLETPEISFLWSSETENKISSLLRTQAIGISFDAEETQEFIEFLLSILREFTPLKALRYQLGSL